MYTYTRKNSDPSANYEAYEHIVHIANHVNCSAMSNYSN